MKRSEQLAAQAARVRAIEARERHQRPANVTDETILSLELHDAWQDELARRREAEAARDHPEPRALNPEDPSDYVCWPHRWLGTPRIPGAPRTPCPHCLAGTRPESDEERTARLKPVEYDPAKVRVTSKIHEAWREHRIKLEDAGVPIPGSHAEQLALDRINEGREEELERERRKSRNGRLLSARIEDGVWVEWREVTRKVGRHQTLRQVIRTPSEEM